MHEIKYALERPFEAKQIHWRCGARTKDKKKGVPLAYIDARDAMRRLDDVVGFSNWQNRYTLADNGLLICDIGLRLDGEWVWRSNGAGDTQVEAEKGKASDAFKRAAVMWGIGRYLYSLPNTWLEIDDWGKFKSQPELPHWATPVGWDKAYLGKLTGWDVPMLEVITQLKAAIEAKDYTHAAQLWYSLSEDEQTKVWVSTERNGPFTTREREVIQKELRSAKYGEAA